ncbi:MAG: hypothetical protein WCP55_12775 [Lentisphaerota bacterium]
MTIYYLMIKTHNITGLKYLCQTTRKDPHKYLGSGIYWRDHLASHGNTISTEIIRECKSEKELSVWGLHYSGLWNIVDAKDDLGKKTWANLIPEDGNRPPVKISETPEQRESRSLRELSKNLRNHDLTTVAKFKEHVKSLFVDNGMGLREIAKHLNINVETVSFHLPLTKEERKEVWMKRRVGPKKKYTFVTRNKAVIPKRIRKFG